MEMEIFYGKKKKGLFGTSILLNDSRNYFFYYCNLIVGKTIFFPTFMVVCNILFSYKTLISFVWCVERQYPITWVTVHIGPGCSANLSWGENTAGFQICRWRGFPHFPSINGLLAVFQQKVRLHMSPSTLSVYQVCIHHLSHLCD